MRTDNLHRKEPVQYNKSRSEYSAGVRYIIPRCEMIDISIRLRRAIHSNDLLLVKRIVKNNPTYIRNPDYADKSNSSLHLATKLGCIQIVTWLIEAGHEDAGISLNTDFETPLMVACEAKQVEVGQLLIQKFQHCIPWSNKVGMDALMLSSRNGVLPLLSSLLSHPTHPSSPLAHDKDGNTALHYASASGELKALRLLLQYNASPLAQNAYSWTPIAYSATTAAEAYFKQLVAEFEIRRVAAVKESREKERLRGIGGVRLVTGAGPEDGPPGPPGPVAVEPRGELRTIPIEGRGLTGETRTLSDGRTIQHGVGIDGRSTPMDSDSRAASAAGFRSRMDSFGDNARMDWSPVVERGTMTPTEQRRAFDFTAANNRRRAGSGE